MVANPRSRNILRAIANNVREQLDLSNELKFPIVEVIEMLVADSDELNLEIVSEGEMADTYGMTNTAQNVIRIRQSVYEGAIHGNPRDRFTLCHELGHWLLHQPESVSLARGNVPAYCDPEWQANTFAAELLIPYNLVKGMSIEEIIEQCCVSYSCAEIQMRYC